MRDAHSRLRDYSAGVSNQMNGIAVGFGVVLAITIVEIVLSARWNLFYFTVGLPIFMRRVDRVVTVAELSLDELQQSTATVAGTPILFRRLAPDTIAFREKPFGGSMHYMPIMHGLIRRRAEEASVVVLGFANWYIVALILMFAVLTGKDFLDVAPYLLGAVAIVYLIQSVRYSRVVKVLRRPQPVQEGSLS